MHLYDIIIRTLTQIGQTDHLNESVRTNKLVFIPFRLVCVALIRWCILISLPHPVPYSAIPSCFLHSWKSLAKFSFCSAIFFIRVSQQQQFPNNRIDSVWIFHSCVDLPSHNKKTKNLVISIGMQWFRMLWHFTKRIHIQYTSLSSPQVLSTDEETQQNKCDRMVLQQWAATKDDDSNGGRSCSSSSIKIYYQLNEQ